jgi:subtilisin family serine protease
MSLINRRLYLRISLLALLCWQADLSPDSTLLLNITESASAADRPAGNHFTLKKRGHQQQPRAVNPPARQPAAAGHTRQAAKRHRTSGSNNNISHAPKRGANRAGTRRRHVQKQRTRSLAGTASHITRSSQSSVTTSTIQHHTDTLSSAVTSHVVDEVQSDSEVHHTFDVATPTESTLPDEHVQYEESVHQLTESHFPLHEKSVILVVNPNSSSLDAAQQQGLHASSTITLSHLGISLVSLAIPEGGDTLQALENLQNTGASRALLNTYYQLDTEELSETIAQSPAAKFPFSWCKPCHTSGRGIRIGMVDSSVDQHRQELSHQQIHCKDFVHDKEAKKKTDHGTAIAELLVGFTNGGFSGMVPGATLYAAAAFPEKSRDSPGATVLTILQALDWLVSRHVQVINLSFSGPDNALLAMAVEKIQELGIAVVAAAGNHGPQAEPAYPGAYRDVIAVTAVDQFRRPYRNANQGNYIGFAAPGVRVPVPGSDGTMSYKTGTSFATPFATGLLAVQLARWGKDTTIPEMLTRLKKSAEDLGKPGKDPVFGWGLLHCNSTCSGSVDS